MRTIVTILLTYVALSLLAGCGSTGDGGNGIGLRPVTTTGRYKSLQFTGSTNLYNTRKTPIPITFTVTNTGTDPIPYHYGGCAEFSAVAKSYGTVVATITVPYGCAANVKDGVFAPGETKTFKLNWDQVLQDGTEARPGKYTIEVQLDVYDLGPDNFLTQSGIQYPATLGPDPLTIYIQ